MIAEVEVKSDVVVVRLEGSLDISLQDDLKSNLSNICREKKQSDLVLDFEKVTFIDSSCLGALVSFAKELREDKGDLKLSTLSDDVISIFQITRLDKIFDIFDALDEAVESFYR